MDSLIVSALVLLDEQGKRAEAATKGLWRHEDFPLPGTSARYHDVTYGPADDASERFSVLEELTEADGEFIATARLCLPRDVKLLRALLAFYASSYEVETLDDRCNPNSNAGKMLAALREFVEAAR